MVCFIQRYQLSLLNTNSGMRTQSNHSFTSKEFHLLLTCMDLTNISIELTCFDFLICFDTFSLPENQKRKEEEDHILRLAQYIDGILSQVLLLFCTQFNTTASDVNKNFTD